MKTFVLSLFVALSTMAYGQKKALNVKPVEVDPQDFTMTMLYMVPRKFPMKALNREYSVTVHNDSLVSYLPYMGEVYQPTLTDDGLNFKLPIEEALVKEKKKCKHVYYRVRRGFLTYDYHFIFYPEGKGSLILTPSNAQDCTYDGEWENH